MEPNPTIQDAEAEPEFDDNLPRQQKLEMLGALAAFIAHDLNNELTVILGNLGLSVDSLQPDHPAIEGLLEADRAAGRCVEMTRGLLNLGQSVKPELKPVALDELLKSTERILRKVLPSTLPTRFAKYAHLPAVIADATQVQQVIMNLAANASRAMPAESLLEVHAKHGPKCVTISITVSNVSKIHEAPKRLFQPLSADKANHEGRLGLGRDIEIIRTHGGSIDVARDPNSIT